MIHRDPPNSARPDRLLVVEDDALLRALAVDYFEECGYPVLQASTADAALPILQDDARIAVVFSDVQMPGTLDGVGLARWIARERAGVKVVLTSGKVQAPAGAQCRFIAKPYRLADVEEALHALTS